MIAEISVLSDKNDQMAELTASKAARVLGVDRDTVRRWCLQGLVASRQVGLRRDWHIDMDDLRRFALRHNYKFNENLARQLALE